MSILRRNFSPLRIYLPVRGAPSSDPPTPDVDVVLVQGFLTTPAALDPVRRRLEAMGLSSAVAPLGGLRGQYQTGRTTHCATRLANWLEARDPARPAPWIVAHSMGGIIARQAVQQLSMPAAGVVTLGTPHRGTPTALLGLLLGPVTRAPLDLLPLNRRIRRLNRMPWPDEVPLISISGGADLLTPSPFSRLPLSGPRIRTRHYRGMGHTELLGADEVHAELIAALRRGG